MMNRIKNTINAELRRYMATVKKKYMRSSATLLWDSLQEFIARDGKRIRPLLFLHSYQGYSTLIQKKQICGAIAFELLHNFMLIHDDIIDHSMLRRNKRSMHSKLQHVLDKFERSKISGADLSLIAGDLMYALSISSFLLLKVHPKIKEVGLREMIKAGIYTGLGEYLELMQGKKSLSHMHETEIYSIYDLKTAYYTAAMPLAIGALCANPLNRDVRLLRKLGLLVGRAFQIKDDLFDIVGKGSQIGKDTLSDIAERKKTLLLWFAYRQGSCRLKKRIAYFSSRQRHTKETTLLLKAEILKSGAISYAVRKLNELTKQSFGILTDVSMKNKQKKQLKSLIRELLSFRP